MKLACLRWSLLWDRVELCGNIGLDSAVCQVDVLMKKNRLIADMIELTRRYCRFGYRPIATLLRNVGWQENDKRVERLWRR